MSISMIGIDSKSYNVSEREKYFKSQEEYIKQNQYLIEKSIVKEIITLSTCNRVEHYFYSNQYSKVLEILFNSQINCISKNKEKEIAKHLFRVSSGLESEIIGENEVLGQVKQSYLNAYNKGHAKKYLNILFQKAISVGKKVRTLSNLSTNSLSIGGIILDIIKNLNINIKNKTLLLIGTGKISKTIALSLNKKSIKQIHVTGRKEIKGKAFAEAIKGKFIPLKDLYKTTKYSDIIISVTSSQNYIFEKQHKSFLENNNKIIFDLSVPRDFDPYFSKIKTIKLFNIDSINSKLTNNILKRKKEIKLAEEIIDSELIYYLIDSEKRFFLTK